MKKLSSAHKHETIYFQELLYHVHCWLFHLSYWDICDAWYSKCFLVTKACIVLWYPGKNLVGGWVLKHRETVDLPKVTHLDSSRPRIWTQAVSFLGPLLIIVQHHLEIEGKVKSCSQYPWIWSITLAVSPWDGMPPVMSCQLLKNEWSMQLFYILAGEKIASASKIFWEHDCHQSGFCPMD